MNMDIFISKAKRLVKAILVIAICALLGQVLMILVYSLPTDVIARNIEAGAEALLIQGAAYNYAEDYRETILDNETDAIMLSEALFPEKPWKLSGGGTSSQVCIYGPRIRSFITLGGT